MSKINTIIQLRNDTATAWETEAGKATPLQPGEAAVVINEDGSVRMKVGTAENQTFEAAPFLGSEEAQIYQVSYDYGTTQPVDIDDIAATVIPEGKTINSGDMLIIKAAIDKNNTKYSYASYVYDADLDDSAENGSKWSAMDGNYSAANVFIKDDITLAGAFTSVGNYNKGATINAGTSLETILSGMLQQELYPTTNDKPNTEISVSGGSGEVGTQYTLPTATLKIKDVGSFEYGDKTTGITFAIGDVKLVQGADPTSTTANQKTNTAVMVKDSTITLQATDNNAVDNKLYYEDTSKSFTFTGTAKYSDSVIPVTNLNNPYPASQIKSATITMNQANNNTHKTATFSGYRYAFAGGTTAALSSEVVRAATAKKNSKTSMDTEGEALEFTAAQGATKIFFAYPSTWTGTPYFEMFGLAWAENSDFVAEDNIQVADARGIVDGVLQGAVAYKVYAWTPAGPLTAESTKFRVWFK